MPIHTLLFDWNTELKYSKNCPKLGKSYCPTFGNHISKSETMENVIKKQRE